MPFDEELLEAMPDTILLQRYLGKDAFGNTSYGVTEAVRANVEVTVSRGTSGDQEDSHGPEVNVVGTIITPPVGIKPRDKITLPSLDVTYVEELTTYRDAPDAGDYVQQIDFKEKK